MSNTNEINSLLSSPSVPLNVRERIRELYLLIQDDIETDPSEPPFNLESLKSLIHLYECSKVIPSYTSLTYSYSFHLEFEIEGRSITIRCLPNNTYKVLVLCDEVKSELTHDLIQLLL